MAGLVASVLLMERTRGDTYPFTIVLKDSSGVVIDITGSSFVMTVDPSESPTGDLANLFELSGVLTAPTAGEVVFTLTTDNADNVGEYFYDIQQLDPFGYLRTVLRGDIVFTQDITKTP